MNDKTVRIVSWNVNGIRALAAKGFYETMAGLDCDVLCLQEIKASPEDVPALPESLKHYSLHVNSAEQRGYSGTAVYSRIPISGVHFNTGSPEHGKEGRVITVTFDEFHLVNTYVPNSGSDLKRLDYRQEWDRHLLDYLKKLDRDKPVVFTGDLNVAHEPIDLARPAQNYNKTSGYTQAEIDGFKQFLAAGFVDTYRMLHGNKVQYTYWSQRFSAREKNLGWRIDYFLVSQRLADKVKDAYVLDTITGSDHCPLGIVLRL